MGKELSSIEKAALLVEYARGGKNPSIWWNGVEYKWDKKHGKYLHWSTLPNGEKRADEPPYEAMNPLFAASGVPATTGDKKTAPKVEPKPDPKVEKKEPTDKEKPAPPMTTNHPIGRERENAKKEPQIESTGERTSDAKAEEGQSATSIFATLSDDMSPEEQKQTIKEWANAFFDGGEKEKRKGNSVSDYVKPIEERLRSFFFDDAVPLYAKQFLLNDMNQGNEVYNTRTREKDVLKRIETCAEGLEKYLFSRDIAGYGNSYMFADQISRSCNATWGELTKPYSENDNDRDVRLFFLGGEPIVGRFSVKPYFGDIDLSKQQKLISEYNTRESAFANIAKIALIPKDDLTPELQETLDRYAKIATKPTTTDYEAAAILNTIVEAGLNVAQSHKVPPYDGSAEYYNDYLKKRISSEILQEIALREPSDESVPSPESQKTTIRPLIPRDRDEARLEEVFAIGRDSFRSKNLAYYTDLCALWRSPQDFRLDEEKFEWFAKAKDVIEDPDVLPGIRSDVLQFAHVCYREGDISNWDGDYKNLARRLECAKKTLTTPEALRIARDLVWDRYLTPKAKKATTRDELVKAASPFRNISSLGDERNSQFKTLEKNLLSLASKPTTTDMEALYIVAKLGKINQQARDLEKNVGRELKIALETGAKNGWLVDPNKKMFRANVDNLRAELSKGAEQIQKELEELTSSTVLLKERAGETKETSSEKSSKNEKPSIAVSEPKSENPLPDEKPLAPMTKNAPDSRENKSVQNAEDFNSVVNQVRSEIMSPKEAERDRKTIQANVETARAAFPAITLYPKALAKYKRQRSKVDGLSYSHPDFDKESDKLHKLFNEGYAHQQKITAYEDLINSKFKIPLNRETREKNLAILRAAFPDQGGSSFFSDEYKNSVIALLRKKGLKEEDARYVFDMYDILGKSFNLSGKTFPAPKIVCKNKRSTSEGGSYSRSKNTITLNGNPNAEICMQTALIHEFGHWLESQVLGDDVMGETREWLANETGDGEKFPKYVFSKDSYRIPREKCPGLCFRADGYSLVVYRPAQYYDENGRIKTDKGGSEAFSTGMEGIGLCPDYFAICNPKHFNRMIDCFNKLFARNR